MARVAKKSDAEASGEIPAPSEPEATEPSSDPDVDYTRPPEVPPEAAPPMPPDVPPDSGSGSYNPFEGEVVSEKRPSEPFSQQASGGVSIEDDMVEASDSESESAREAPTEIKKTKKRKKDEDTLEDYERVTEDATYLLDIAAGFATRSRLEPHIRNGTIHSDTVEKFIASMDLTDRERKKLARVSARYLQAEEVKIEPVWALAMVAGMIAIPRIQKVGMLDSLLKDAKAQGYVIGKDDEILYTPKGPRE